MPLFLHVDITYFVCNTYQSKVTTGTDQFTFSSMKSANKLGLGILLRFSDGIQDWIKIVRIRKDKELLNPNYEAIFFSTVYSPVSMSRMSQDLVYNHMKSHYQRISSAKGIGLSYNKK